MRTKGNAKPKPGDERADQEDKTPAKEVLVAPYYYPLPTKLWSLKKIAYHLMNRLKQISGLLMYKRRQTCCLKKNVIRLLLLLQKEQKSCCCFLLLLIIGVSGHS